MEYHYKSCTRDVLCGISVRCPVDVIRENFALGQTTGTASAGILWFATSKNRLEPEDKIDTNPKAINMPHCAVLDECVICVGNPEPGGCIIKKLELRSPFITCKRRPGWLGLQPSHSRYPTSTPGPSRTEWPEIARL